MIEQDSCQSRLWRGTRNCLVFRFFSARSSMPVMTSPVKGTQHCRASVNFSILRGRLGDLPLDSPAGSRRVIQTDPCSVVLSTPAALQDSLPMRRVVVRGRARRRTKVPAPIQVRPITKLFR